MLHATFLSPSSSIILLDGVLHAMVTLRNRKTGLYRLSKKISTCISVYNKDSDIVSDVFDDMIDVMSYFHLCHYNICLIMYISLFIYVFVKNLQIFSKR